MAFRKENPDKLTTKQPKGMWLRFVKVFGKCRLPWVWLLAYLAMEMGIITLGVNETDYTARLFAGDTSASLVFTLVIMILINLVGTNLLVFFRGIASARIIRNTQNVLLDKVFKLPMSFFQKENPREAVYRIVDRSVMVESTIMVVLVPIYSAAFKIVSIAGKVFTYDWRLTAIMLGFVPVQLLIGFLFGRLSYSVTKRDVDVNTTLTRKLGELVANIPLAKAFAREDREEAKGREYTQRLYKLNITASWLGQFKDLSETAANLIQSLVIVGVGMLLLKDGDITKRGWISFFLFSGVFSGAIGEFVMYWNNLKTIQGGAEAVAEVLDAKEEDRSGAACPELQGDIQLKDVSFSYEENTPVLQSITCSFPDNCVTALLGVSGSGKTTLTHLVSRLYPVGGGIITAGGKNIHSFALDEYRKHFVVVSQSGLMFRGTVRENVCYGYENVTEEALIVALKQAQAYDFVMSMPDGLDAMLDEYGGNLSGGQRQRLGVARALLSDAHYMILDEPVASMDAIATSELLELLGSITKGRCVILIAHTDAVLPLADRVVILEEGKVSGQGRVEDVLRTNTFLQQMTGKEAPL